MTHLISIVTAVLAGRHDHLLAAYESLCEQELPDGWEWQWIVQEDGETGEPASVLPADERILTGNGPRGRQAMARTLALSRADGVLVRALDADDVLPKGALAQEITALVANPSIAWSVSPALDLLDDGTIRPGPRDPDPGPLPRSFLVDGARNGLLQVMATTFCGYTELVRAVGGWSPLPAGEEVALLLAAEAVSDGLMLPNPGLLYRRWSGNTTPHVDKSKPHFGSHDAVHSVPIARADALRATGWRWVPPSL